MVVSNPLQAIKRDCNATASIPSVTCQWSPGQEATTLRSSVVRLGETQLVVNDGSEDECQAQYLSGRYRFRISAWRMPRRLCTAIARHPPEAAASP